MDCDLILQRWTNLLQTRFDAVSKVNVAGGLIGDCVECDNDRGQLKRIMAVQRIYLVFQPLHLASEPQKGIFF